MLWNGVFFFFNKMDLNDRATQKIQVNHWCVRVYVWESVCEWFFIFWFEGNVVSNSKKIKHIHTHHTHTKKITIHANLVWQVRTQYIESWLWYWKRAHCLAPHKKIKTTQIRILNEQNYYVTWAMRVCRTANRINLKEEMNL